MVLYAWTEPLPVSVSSKPKRRSVDLVLTYDRVTGSVLLSVTNRWLGLTMAERTSEPLPRSVIADRGSGLILQEGPNARDRRLGPTFETMLGVLHFTVRRRAG